MFSSGLEFGLDGLWSVIVPRSAWYTKKPLALGSSPFVEGRYAPIGLFGLALIPRYESSAPLVHAAVLKRDAVALAVPVSAKLSADGFVTVFGTSTSTNRSPELGPGDVVNPKLAGGFMLVGEFVPLSTH
jgi:hypothetical protein